MNLTYSQKRRILDWESNRNSKEFMRLPVEHFVVPPDLPTDYIYG